MKTNETRAASQPQRLPASEVPRKKEAFSKILERKSGEEKTPAVVPQASVQPLLQRNAASEEARPVRGTVTVDLDGLAREIQVTVRGSDLREVEIQMDSKTMAGLQIRITRENGKLNVRMQTNSADVSRLLAQQSDALAQRLEARGYQGAVVQVQSPSSAGMGDARGKERRGQDSGDRGNSKQRQERQDRQR
ncbi:MAG: flagellar hook-length control protein FliK [Candidatus Solibacter sp.]|nr:flagellar hook-length control protein FliK [Candidatus Solibacter sp.]